MLTKRGPNWLRKLRGKIVCATGLATVLLFPLLSSIRSPQVFQRINETSLFSTSKAVVATNALREAEGYTLLSHLLHHRYWYWSSEIVAGIVSHFNINFLFISGDDNARHQTGFVALLYPWMIVPLLIGLMNIIWGKEKESLIFIWWVILAAIPPALTNLTPHTLRFLPGVPALAIIMGYGMMIVWKWSKQRLWLNSILVGVIALSVFVHVYDLWWVYPKRSSQVWQYGYKEVFQFIEANYLDKPIYLTRKYGRPSIYALWYLKIDPALTQTLEPTLPKDQGELLALESMYFDNRTPLPNSVIVSEKSDLPYTLKHTVNFLDGSIAFYLYEN